VRKLIDRDSQQGTAVVVCFLEADGHVARTGLVNDENLLEWEIMIIGYVIAVTHY
jgi:hypothetical protein